jgi:hypothetical protein
LARCRRPGGFAVPALPDCGAMSTPAEQKDEGTFRNVTEMD